MGIQEPQKDKAVEASWGAEIAKRLNKLEADGARNQNKYGGEFPRVPLGLWELTTDVSCASSSGNTGPHTPSAYAVRVRLDHTTKRYVARDASETARIYFPSVVPAEDSPDCFYADLVIGNRVWCYDNEESGRWEISGRPQGETATHILCDVDVIGGVAEDTADFLVDNVRIMLPIGATRYPVTWNVAPDLVQNTHGWLIDDGALVQATWNQNDDQWETTNVDCPA